MATLISALSSPPHLKLIVPNRSPIPSIIPRTPCQISFDTSQMQYFSVPYLFQLDSTSFHFNEVEYAYIRVFILVQYTLIHCIPVKYVSFQFIPVHSSLLLSSILWSRVFQSSPFQSIPVYSSLLCFSPVQSSPFQSIPVYSSQLFLVYSDLRYFNPVHSSPNPVYSSSFQFISVHSSLLYFSPVQFSPVYSSPFQSTVSSIF